MQKKKKHEKANILLKVYICLKQPEIYYFEDKVCSQLFFFLQFPQFCLFRVVALHLGQQFFSHVGRFSWLNQY